jgi:hypothetical protein
MIAFLLACEVAYAAPMSDHRMTLVELSTGSNSIYLGEVIAAGVEVSNGSLYTVATVMVTQTLKGQSQGVIDVRWPGGILDNVTIDSPNSPHVTAGRNYVFFLTGDIPTGLADGVLEVMSNDIAYRPRLGSHFESPHIFDPNLDPEPMNLNFEGFTLDEIKIQALHSNCPFLKCND